MKEKILTFYNNNKRKILLILIVIVILIALPRVLQFFTKGTENEPINLNEKKDPVQNNLNTSVIETEESVISGENLDTSQKTYVELIDNFVVACNNGNTEKAYGFLSTDCREELYPSMESFKDNYYNQVFHNGKKTALIKNWMNNIFKIDYTNDILSSGVYNEDENIQEYITVVDDNGNIKLNINNYIGKTEINRTTNYMNIQVKVLSKKIYMDYEVYTFEIQNNSKDGILLDDRQNIETMYIEDDSGNKYEAYTHELTNSMLTVPSGATRNINIKYYNKYSTNKIMEKVVFSKVILNNEWYLSLENKNVYDYYGIIELGL